MIPRAQIVVVTGLSGAGRTSILRTLEDLGFDTVDNLPLSLLPPLMAMKAGREFAVGVDIRTDGFDIPALLEFVAAESATATDGGRDLIFATAEHDVLLRRYKETRRRHPMAVNGCVSVGIEQEARLTQPLREAADLVLDTSDSTLADLQRAIQGRYGSGGFTISLVSFAFPKGLPRESDMVIDARFLRNPHYDPVLRPKTGQEADVGAYVAADEDFKRFFSQICDLLDLTLPRFVQEGKKYATISIGCTGGRHRSVFIVEQLKQYLSLFMSDSAWQVAVTHRELEQGRAG